MPFRNATAVAASLLIAGTLLPSQAAAQALPLDETNEEGAVADPASPLALDPVTVTARKREELLEDVPMSITVIYPEETTLSPFASAESISRATPNFTINDSGNTRLTFGNIRGVGILAQPLSPVDTAIGWAIDGTIQPTFGSNSQLLDIERVEVLRGPQNTLFGRGTQGGAVNVVTNVARFGSEFSVNGEFGENEYVKVDTVANGTVSPDLLAGRLALRFANYGGDIENIVAGGQDGESILGAAQGSLLLTPDDRVTAVLRAYYEDDRRDTPPFILRDGPDFPASALNPENDLDRRLANTSLELTYDLDSLTLSSTTSFHSNRQKFTSDLSDALISSSQLGLPQSFFNDEDDSVRNATLTETAYQQEFNVSAPDDAAFQWLVGTNIYYSDFELESDERDIIFDFNNSLGDTSLDTLSYSAFGETTFAVLEPLSATLGVRVGRDEQDLDSLFIYTGPPNPIIVPRFEQNDRDTDNYVVGSAALVYALTPEDNIYASVRRGRAPGGFATLNRNQFIGQPQIARPASESWTYEVGAKLTAWDGRLRLDAAGFFNDVEDAAFIAFDPAVRLSVPVALSYQSYGFEVEGRADLGAGFTLFGGVGMTEAEFDDVPTNNPAGAEDGGDVPNVPRWSAAVSLDYAKPLQLLNQETTLLARFEWQFKSDREADVANTFTLDSYNVFNAQVGFALDDMEFYAFARNLTDERYETLGARFGANTEVVSVGQGRVIGVGASIWF